MIIKLLGIALIIFGFVYSGLLITATHKREVQIWEQFIISLNYMESELQYRHTPLPQLCRATAANCSGCIAKIYTEFAKELDNQISPDAKLCMQTVLINNRDLPKRIHNMMLSFGEILGRFDLEGQLRDIEAFRSMCARQMSMMIENQDVRLRNARTTCICAGIALVIILL